MISFLSRLLIQNREQLQNPTVRRAYGMLCSITGIFLNVLLFAGKYFAGLISGSVAVQADAFNNLSDAGSSFITMVGFHFSGMKPDKDHPFGHGRIEYISGLAVSVLILLMGYELARSSLDKILHPSSVDSSVLVICILVASILVKGYMYLYNRRIGEKIDSSAMKATATDSLSDVITTCVVLLSTLVGRFTQLQLDGWCGALVAVFILRAGYNAAKDTLTPLLGTAPDPEYVQQIQQTVMAYPEVLGIHDLIVHDYGPGRRMISLHAEVPSNGDLLQLHDTIDRIERELNHQLGMRRGHPHGSHCHRRRNGHATAANHCRPSAGKRPPYDHPRFSYGSRAHPYQRDPLTWWSLAIIKARQRRSEDGGAGGKGRRG